MGIATTHLRPLLLLALARPSAGVESAQANDVPAPPRYRLKAGQELTYRTVSRTERKEGETTYRVDWKAWVVGRDADGGWRLVLRCDLRTTRPSEGGKKEEDPLDTLLWRCRLFDDGRLLGATSRGTVRDPFRLFPRLPADARAMAGGWESPGAEKDNATQRYRMVASLKPGDPTLAFAMTSEGPENKVYVLTHGTRSTFDLGRGLVTRVETEDTSGYGIKGTTRGTIELVSVEDHPAGWVETFAPEADACFSAVEAYELAYERAGRDARGCKARLVEAKGKLEAAGKSLNGPAFRAKIDAMLAEHDRMAKYATEQAEKAATLIGKPAADWEAKALDGKTRRMADYRGKVVVLDFWYRGCGWCMTAMPQVNRLSETFRDEPVAVLGMTIDEDEKDARVVVDAMKLRYPAILAKGLPEKFGVEGYPTLIVIDRQGKVRQVHVGYSPRLYDEISTLIRGLLAEKPAE